MGPSVDRSELARQLGSGPKQKRYTRVCLQCGTVFQTTKRGAFCKPVCSAKWHREHGKGAMAVPIDADNDGPGDPS